MDDRTNKYWIAILINSIILLGAYFWKTNQKQIPVAPPPISQPPPIMPPVKPEPPKDPDPYQITKHPGEYISYSAIVDLMRRWNLEAPEISEFGVYGETSRGIKCTYLRIGTPGKPKVMITAELHGNEKLSTGATLWIMQRMLHDFGRNPEVTWLVKNRDVYFVPVVSPDTHMRSRHVEGRDPNRDFPYPGRRAHTPTSPVQAIMDLHLKHKFKGVISGHTYGVVYFYPSIGPSSDQQIHKKIADGMSQRSGYRNSRISSRPNGFEIDWYYWKGAVAILTEFGSGTHNQRASAIKEHGDKNYEAYLYFIKEAPEQQLQPPNSVYWKNYRCIFPEPSIHINEDTDP